MNRQILEFLTEKTHELIKAPTCSSETKEAAQKWLAALGTDAQGAETKAYIDELKEDIMPIDNLIAFAQSTKGAEYFGAEQASGIAAHAIEIKSVGAKYCDCPACAIVEEILVREDEILK